MVDVYVATVLKELSEFGQIPHPSKNYKNLKVIYPRYTSNRLAKEGNERILYQFKNFKISKDEIHSHPDKYVMIIRPSMKTDLERISGIDDGNLIYSMWEGYMKKNDTKQFIEYFKKRGFSIHSIHTSGHADIDTLKQLVDAIKPKCIVPIHTFNAGEYKSVFSVPILELKDGEII